MGSGNAKRRGAVVEEICNGERISWLIMTCMAGVRYVAKKLVRAFNPISFSGVRYVDVVTCPVLVLYLSCTCLVRSSLRGRINQHVAVAQFVMFAKGKIVFVFCHSHVSFPLLYHYLLMANLWKFIEGNKFPLGRI